MWALWLSLPNYMFHFSLTRLKTISTPTDCTKIIFQGNHPHQTFSKGNGETVFFQFLLWFLFGMDIHT